MRKLKLSNSRILGKIFYFGFENGVPDRVPISLRGLEGPQEPTKENNHEVEPIKKSPANFGLNRE